MPRLDHIFFKDSNTEYQILLDIIYPINSVIVTIGNNSPASTLGGTWVEILDGLVSCCGSGTNYPGRGNGEWQGSWKIETTQLPSHSHGLAGHTHSFSGTTGNGGAHSHTLDLYYHKYNQSSGTHPRPTWTSSETGNQYSVSNQAAHTHSFSGTTKGNSGNTTATGGGQGFLPYSRSFHFWKRTA